MKDFLRKTTGKRKTTDDQQEQNIAVDTAGVATPSERPPRMKRRRRWYLRFARQQMSGWSPILTGNLVSCGSALPAKQLAKQAVLRLTRQPGAGHSVPVQHCHSLLRTGAAHPLGLHGPHAVSCALRLGRLLRLPVPHAAAAGAVHHCGSRTAGLCTNTCGQDHACPGRVMLPTSLPHRNAGHCLRCTPLTKVACPPAAAPSVVHGPFAQQPCSSTIAVSCRPQVGA